MSKKWNDWAGGECPCAPDDVVEVLTAEGDSTTGAGEELEWRHDANAGNIVQWRMLTEAVNPLDVQVGGGHYKGKAIQPVEYIAANNLNFLEGCIVKRITRWRDKSVEHKFQDLEKIKHEVDLLIAMERKYGDDARG